MCKVLLGIPLLPDLLFPPMLPIEYVQRNEKLAFKIAVSLSVINMEGELGIGACKMVLPAWKTVE